MIGVLITEVAVFQKEGARDAMLRRSKKRWILGLFVSLIMGVISLLSGFALGLAAWSGLITKHGSGSVAGTLLIAITFPVMIMAAHCMDKVSGIDRAMRIEYYRHHGLDDWR